MGRASEAREIRETMKKNKMVVPLAVTLLAVPAIPFFGEPDQRIAETSIDPPAVADATVAEPVAVEEGDVLGVNFLEVEPVRLPDYVCPTCGTHKFQGYEGYISVAERKKLPPNIEECRQLYSRIPSVAGLKLDEIEYCRSCSPGIRRPLLSLVIPRTNGKPRRVRGVTALDLRLLGDYYAAPLELQVKMKKDSRRLRKLLGL